MTHVATCRDPRCSNAGHPIPLDLGPTVDEDGVEYPAPTVAVCGVCGGFCDLEPVRTGDAG